MAKCYLKIQFDRPDRTYKPGEKVAGTVEVTPGLDCQCRKITLTPNWTTHGVGKEDSASTQGQVLPGAVWHDVDEASYPFEFSAPAGPLTYRGDLFEVGWFVKAVADLPLAFDAVAEEGFTLIHGDPSTAETSGEGQFEYNPVVAAPAKTKKGIILWFVGVRLQLAGGTNWSTDIPILVRP